MPGETTCEIALVETADEAVKWLGSHAELADGLGVDTATAWSGGPGGWRPADRWLRQRYRRVKSSVSAPNSLYDAFSIGGVYVISCLRESRPDLEVTESHPKVLFQALSHGDVYGELALEPTRSASATGAVSTRHRS